MRKAYRYPLEIDSDYVLRRSFFDVIGVFVRLQMSINNDGNPFPIGRITIGYVPEWIAPEQTVIAPISASSRINSGQDLRANLVLAGGYGAIYVDNYIGSGTIEFMIDVLYPIAPIDYVNNH